MDPIVAIVGAWLGGNRSFDGARRGYCVGGRRIPWSMSRRPPILAGVMVVTVLFFGANTSCNRARDEFLFKAKNFV